MNYLSSPFFVLFFHLYKIFFFSYFFVFLYITIYDLNSATAIKKMSFNEIRDFIFENYYKQIIFSKENSCHEIKPLK